ncbi:uncharacterized protein LY79DRAFT_97501 [Colletotrichum navitas]|uniref:Uncharacterized protein n=1 Tax=Colletotrichum navitas TaxID=681940 RepID=A0AAD8PKR1_9PEZI|nr:uncharacterized protein LY79DRAFT_97501 [Colletotrichum navitas]KAK1566322.1 hypothetical protein LY79DRAFT_97501 [Colletotrichum navitas]
MQAGICSLSGKASSSSTSAFSASSAQPSLACTKAAMAMARNGRPCKKRWGEEEFSKIGGQGTLTFTNSAMEDHGSVEHFGTPCPSSATGPHSASIGETVRITTVVPSVVSTGIVHPMHSPYQRRRSSGTKPACFGARGEANRMRRRQTMLAS